MIKRRTILAASAATLAAPAYVHGQGTINIRMAHSLSTTEPAHLAALYFAKNVLERSNGRVRIEVFPGEQLGSGKDVNEMIRAGANVMNVTDFGYLADFVPDAGIINGPYLVQRHDQFGKLFASDWYKDLDRRIQQSGFRLIMAGGFFGARHMIADKPIRTPADTAGLTVRVPPNTMWLETFKAMGARPATVQWSEVYNALSQGVVQAAEAPYGSLWGGQAARGEEGDQHHLALHRHHNLADQQRLLHAPAARRAGNVARGRSQGRGGADAPDQRDGE